MAMTPRITAARDVVSVKDPALDKISDKALQLYVGSRNIEDLGDLSELTDKPTIFRCLPITTIWENSRLSFLEDKDANSAWLIFATHVESIKNFPDAPVPVREIGRRDTQHLPDDSRDLFGPELVIEISRVICEMPEKGDISPFSPPDGWQRARILRSSYLALKQVGVPSTKEKDMPTVQETSLS